jgi:hypothetical protein
VIFALLTDANASSMRRRRATDGFMGAPSRKHTGHCSRKEIATDVAGGVVSAVGNATIEEAKENRTHSN